MYHYSILFPLPPSPHPTVTKLPYVFDEYNECHDEAIFVTPEIVFYLNTIFHDIYQFYAYFQDFTEPIFHPSPSFPYLYKNSVRVFDCVFSMYVTEISTNS